EGRVLLAKVREKAGDAAAAQKLRQEAWDEYASSPPAHRRRDRWFAWQAKPARPIAYGAVALFVIVGFALFGAPRLREAVEGIIPHRHHASQQMQQQQQPVPEDDGEP